MSQRGQLSESTLHYLIVLVCVAAILGVGYFSFNSVQDRLCKTELSKFQLDVKGIDREVGQGSLIEKIFDIPCDADEVYFVDSNKAKAEYFANPLIRDAINSSVEKNVFVVKDGKVETSFFAGDLQMEYPGYSCMEPRLGKVDTFAEGKGSGVDIIPGCYQVECTDVPITPSQTEADEILNQFKSSLLNCPYCPGDSQEILDNIGDYFGALNALKVVRRYTYCPDTGLTKVEIIVSPELRKKLKNFRFFEYIPKECIPDLEAFLQEMFDGEATATFTDPDPLLMWQFDELSAETTLSYTLNTQLTENCRDIIAGIGIPEIIADEGIIETIEDNDPPWLSLQQSPILLESNKQKIDMFLNGYVDDDHDPDAKLVWSDPQVSPADKGLSVSIDSDNRNQLIISHAGEWSGDATISFTVTDTFGKSTTDSMTVRIIDAIPLNPIPDVTLVGIGASTAIDLSSYADFFGRSFTTSITQTNPSAVSCTVAPDMKSISCTSASVGESEIGVVITDNDYPDLKSYGSFTVHIVPSTDDFYTYTCKVKNGEDCVQYNLIGNPDHAPCSGNDAEKKGCCGGILGNTACKLTGGFVGKVKYQCTTLQPNPCQPSTEVNPCDGHVTKTLKQKTQCTPSCSTGTPAGDCVTSAHSDYTTYAGYRCIKPTPTTLTLSADCTACGCPSPKVCHSTTKTCQTPPTISVYSMTSFSEGGSGSFVVSVTDPDGLPVALTYSPLPSSSSFNSATNTFSWVPSYDQAGSYSVTFTATDSTGLSSTKTVPLTVANVIRNCPGASHGSCTSSYQYCTDGSLTSSCDNRCCSSPNTCGGNGNNNVCGCSPNCVGKICGALDGCGGQCSSGSCAITYQTCGGVGTANVCGCSPTTSCAAQGKNCGTIFNGCENINCGSCAGTQTCQSGQCTAQMCSDSTIVGSCSLSQLGKKCVLVSGSVALYDDPACAPAQICTPSSRDCYDSIQWRQCNSAGTAWNTPASCGFNSYGLGRICTGAGVCKDRLEVSTSKTSATCQGSQTGPCCTYSLTLQNNQNTQITIRDIISDGFSYTFFGPINIGILAGGSSSYNGLGTLGNFNGGNKLIEFKDSSNNIIGKKEINC